MGICASLVLLVVALGLTFAPRSEAYVYWSNWVIPNTDPATISRADLDGTGQEFNYIAGAPDTQPTGLSLNDSHIFWANSRAVGPETIGRAPLDGRSADQEFIELTSAPTGTAINDTHIYWAEPVTVAVDVGLLGRANLDGSSPNESFIAGASVPVEVAVSPTHIYWANQLTDSIGRAPLDDPLPADVEFDFLDSTDGVADPNGVAVDGSHVYWTNIGNDTIGRAELDGTNVDPDYIGNAGADQPCDVAVHDGKLYWANMGADFSDRGSIGRADIGATASNVDRNFISGTNVDEPCGIAADNLSDPACQDFTVNTTPGKPVTFNLRCTGGGLTHELTSIPINGQITDFNPATGRLTYTPDPGFLGQEPITHHASNAGSSDASDPATATIVVSRAPSGPPNPPSPPPPAGKPSNDFTLGKAKRNKKKGTAKLPVAVPGAGSLELRGKKVKPRSKEAAAEGRVMLAVKPKRKAKKKLKKRGKAKVRLAVTFSPTGGDPATKSAKVKLKKRKKRR